MTVRAKFGLVQATTYLATVVDEDGNYSTAPRTSLKFQVVHGNTPENQKFFDSTPSGVIELGIVKPDVLYQFEIGKEYYIDFIPAE